jgi:ABC-type spermidine/putrescine transport system permease subunit II
MPGVAEGRRGAVNVDAAIPWTLLRALAISLAALGIGAWLARSVAGLRGAWRTGAWALLLLPALTPSIVIGYSFAHGWLAGGARADWNERFYASVLLLKLVPIATVVFTMIPAPISRSSLHCYRMLGPQPLTRTWRFRFHAAGRGPAIAFTLVFLLAFTEFELASLCNVRSWTVALFDAHAGGLPLTASLRLAALPAVVEALALATLWLAIRGAGRAVTPPIAAEPRPMGAALASYLVFPATLTTVIPLLKVVRHSVPGISTLVETFALGTDLAASATFALGASLAAWFAVRHISLKPARAAVASIPGLLGALVLSLIVLSLFQLPGLRVAYDTFAPLLLALMLLLLPMALLLRWILDATRPGSAVFVAGQLGHRELVWRLDGRRRFAAWALLFCWAFFDFTAASILAPVGFTPVFVRLHNLMHYGQTAVLSAMVCAALATPLVVLLVTGAIARLHARHHAR